MISDIELDSIRNTFKNLEPTAAGYRVLIRPIDATQGLEAAEASDYETLAAAGFTTKTKNQEERESKGSDVGVVVDIGPYAYQAEHLRGEWCERGDIVLFRRYEGHQFEWPPGSGYRYHLVNDEDIFGIARSCDE